MVPATTCNLPPTTLRVKMMYQRSSLLPLVLCAALASMASASAVAGGVHHAHSDPLATMVAYARFAHDIISLPAAKAQQENQRNLQFTDERWTMTSMCGAVGGSLLDDDRCEICPGNEDNRCCFIDLTTFAFSCNVCKSIGGVEECAEVQCGRTDVGGYTCDGCGDYSSGQACINFDCDGNGNCTCNSIKWNDQDCRKCMIDEIGNPSFDCSSVGGPDDTTIREDITMPDESCSVDDPDLLGNGVCNGGEYNTPECTYDGGDCAEFNKKYPDCRRSDGKYGSCSSFNATYPGCKVQIPEFIGDGEFCDPGEYNTAECHWDGGDCIDFNRKYPNCKVPKPWYVGDGFCDDNEKYNIAECDWDGGDCPIEEPNNPAAAPANDSEDGGSNRLDFGDTWSGNTIPCEDRSFEADPNIYCACFRSCVECNSQSECEWDREGKRCSKKSFLGTKDTVTDCACEKCKAFIQTQQSFEATQWIYRLPLCYCEVTEKSFLGVDYLAIPFDQYPGFGSISDLDWDNVQMWQRGSEDIRCLKTDGGFREIPFQTSPLYYENVCCYDGKRYINHGEDFSGAPRLVSGAGSGPYSPRKEWLKEYEHHDNCCRYCEDADTCSLYKGNSKDVVGVRGDNRGCVRDCENSVLKNRVRGPPKLDEVL